MPTKFLNKTIFYLFLVTGIFSSLSMQAMWGNLGDESEYENRLPELMENAKEKQKKIILDNKKEYVVFIGTTGAGRSTMIYYLKIRLKLR